MDGPFTSINYENNGKEIWDNFTNSFGEKCLSNGHNNIRIFFNTIKEINTFSNRYSNLYNDINHSYRIIYYLEELIIYANSFNDDEKFLLYMSAFLHDIGKPNPENIPQIIYDCYHKNNDVKIDDAINTVSINTIFKEHNKISACLLNEIGKEKGWPTQILNALKFICECHNMSHENILSNRNIKLHLRKIENKHIPNINSINYPLINTNVNLEKIVLAFEMADTIEDFQPFRSIDNLLLKLVKPPITNEFREKILKKSYINYFIQEDNFLLLLDLPQKIREELTEQEIGQLNIIKTSVKNKYSFLRNVLRSLNCKAREIDTDIAGIEIDCLGV